MRPDTIPRRTPASSTSTRWGTRGLILPSSVPPERSPRTVVRPRTQRPFRAWRIRMANPRS